MRHASLGWSAFLSVLALMASLACGQGTERWFIIELDGQRTGWMRSLDRTEDGLITSESEQDLTMGRGAAAVRITMKTVFVETVEGKPVSMRLEQKLGGVKEIKEYTFGEKEIAVRATQFGRVKEETRALPEGTWLPPAAAQRYVEQRMAAGADKIVVRTIEPSDGLDPITYTRSGFEKTEIEISGRKIPVTKCKSVISKYPGIPGTEYLDAQGVPARTELKIGALPMVVTASTEAEARTKVQGPELMVSTFVRPDRKIENPRTSRRAVYILSVPEDELSDLPSAGSQRFERTDARTARIVVDVPHPAPVPASEAGAAAFTAATSTLDCRDEKIAELVGAATAKAGAGRAERAEAIRRFVHRHIRKKNLGVGFATASEVARRREGDCTEHAVLLAAMLRADGIPARVVSGLIYADEFAGQRDIFGYHMWAQAQLERDGATHWVDLDATLGEETSTDATHIAISVSDLADDNVTSTMAVLASLLGRVQIKVESVE